MSSVPPEQEGLADDIVQVTAYEAPEPSRKDFLPWHLPRKQFVRHYQWCCQIEAMLDDHACDGAFRYLGLPGVDLLDLRYFHEQICKPRGLGLRFLGFNKAAVPSSDAQTELNISLDEVRRLEGVDPQSDVIGDDFSRIANSSSIAWKRASALGPFEVINLDLCDGFGKHPPGALDGTHYDAVSKLMSLQSKMKNPWLLLLTTRAGQDHVHGDVLEKLLQKYLENLQACEPFRQASAEHFGIADETAMNSAAATDAGLLPLFLCSLCKWLAGLVLSQNPPSSIEVKSVIGYRVDNGVEHEDLISIAVRFTPTFEPTADPMQLATQPQVVLDEGQAAVQALKRVAKRKNADSLLREDAGLNMSMIEATARLLELARYDPDAYRAWAQPSIPA